MSTLTRTRLGIAIALMAGLAGCSGPCDKLDSINGPALNANGVDLSTYVAVGTSLSSGYESGSLVDRHQVHSFPSIFARQIGKTVELAGGSGSFTQPTVNGDGWPKPLLEIKSYSPLIISRAGRSTGAPTNSNQNFAYHNLGIPGAILFDLLDSTFYHPPENPVRIDFNYMNLVQRSRGTILQQALSLQPTILSLEYGANEVLGPATSGVAPGGGTAPSYAQLMTLALNGIHTALPGTRVAVFNVPDVTTIPFFTTLPPYTIGPLDGSVPLLGVNGPLQIDDHVLLSAADTIATTGVGIPVGAVNYLNPQVPGSGQPLPESLILRAAEVAATQAVIAQMNAIVDSVSARPFVAKVDLAGLLGSIATSGLSLGGADYTNEFVTGGIFSLDGVHPNDLGYALMANTMIDAINVKFGCLVPPVNPLSYASANASALSPVRDRYPLVRGLDQSLRMLFPQQR